MHRILTAPHLLWELGIQDLKSVTTDEQRFLWRPAGGRRQKVNNCERPSQWESGLEVVPKSPLAVLFLQHVGPS